MKRRMIAAGVSFFFLLLLSVVIAGNLDLLLTQGSAACTLHPALILTQLFSSPRALLMALLLAACGLLCVLWALFGNSYLNYRSEMYEVVPGFKIPMPAGQGQYGTAWWMPEKDFDRYFSSVVIPDTLPLSDELISRYEEEANEKHN